jgi:hypothetical protein
MTMESQQLAHCESQDGQPCTNGSERGVAKPLEEVVLNGHNEKYVRGTGLFSHVMVSQ